MIKAYEISGLVEKLKGKGLDIAEEAAKQVVVSVLEWFEESAKLSDNKYDDLALVTLPMIKDEVLKLVDKIDKQEG